EQRNFEAILDMMADHRLDIKPLISHRFELEQAPEAYRVISTGSPLGVMLEYGGSNREALSAKSIKLDTGRIVKPSAAVIGFIGAGNYASSILAPAFSAAGARLKVISSATGVSSIHVGRKYGFEQ